VAKVNNSQLPTGQAPQGYREYSLSPLHPHCCNWNNQQNSRAVGERKRKGLIGFRPSGLLDIQVVSLDIQSATSASSLKPPPLISGG
jgi:hypothetical protein